jgi:hypothetical protein
VSGKLKHTLVVRNPETLEATALLEGSEVPEWATDLVHPDNLDNGKSASTKTEPANDAAPAYGKQKLADLQALVDDRNADRDDDDVITVEGTGKDGKVVKTDLVAALEADDAANA